MALFEKKEPDVQGEAPAYDEGVGTAQDVENLMRKYDRESNTRIWEG